MMSNLFSFKTKMQIFRVMTNINVKEKNHHEKLNKNSPVYSITLFWGIPLLIIIGPHGVVNLISLRLRNFNPSFPNLLFHATDTGVKCCSIK